jgi:hypothetical protein
VYHARGFSRSRTRFSGACTRLQRCGSGWCARALGPVRLSRKILGDVELAAKSWQSSAENSGISGIFASSDASFAGAPITPRERCHVTQPRARINVSCGPQRGDRGRGNHRKEGGEGQRRTAKDSEGQRRVGARPGYQARVPELGQNRTGQGGRGTA